MESLLRIKSIFFFFLRKSFPRNFNIIDRYILLNKRSYYLFVSLYFIKKKDIRIILQKKTNF